MRKIWLLVTVGLMAVLVAAACANETSSERVDALEHEVAAFRAQLGAFDLPSGEREFIITGVELKGSTTTESLAAPTLDPTTLSLGYRYKAPGFDESNPSKWQVASYTFQPGLMVAIQGDEVILRIFIVNGDVHDTWVQDPDGETVVAPQTLNRGREYEIRFAADKPGIYSLICGTHAPTMTANILVLPKLS